MHEAPGHGEDTVSAAGATRRRAKVTRRRAVLPKSSAAPADSEEPGGGGSNRGGQLGARHDPGEPRRRTPRIDPLSAEVFGPISQHVADAAPRLARAVQRTGVVSIGEDASFAPEDAIDSAGEGDEVSLQASKQGGAILGLDDQVQVVGLNRVVDDADASPLDAAAEGVLDGVGDARFAQGGQVLHDSRGDVDRMVSLMERAGFVSFARADGVAGRAAGAGASSSPSREGELELMRSATLH